MTVEVVKTVWCFIQTRHAYLCSRKYVRIEYKEEGTEWLTRDTVAARIKEPFILL